MCVTSPVPQLSPEKTDQYRTPQAFPPSASQQVFWQAALKLDCRSSRSLELSRKPGGLPYSWDIVFPSKKSGGKQESLGNIMADDSMIGYPWLAVTPILQTAGSMLAPILAASWLPGQLGSVSVCLADCRRACCILEILQCPCLKNIPLFPK